MTEAGHWGKQQNEKMSHACGLAELLLCILNFTAMPIKTAMTSKTRKNAKTSETWKS